MVPQPPISAPLWNTVPPEAQAALLGLVESLEQRIAELEAENADLRRRLAQLEDQIQTIRGRSNRTPKRPTDSDRTPIDRRRKGHRQHPGSIRPEPAPGPT